MDHHQHLIVKYQHVLALSEQMLALARSEKWEDLVKLEVNYVKAIESSMQNPVSYDISPEMQEKINSLLEIILKNEAEVKECLQSRLEMLAILIGHTAHQKELNNSYGRISEYAVMSSEHQ